MSPTKTSFVENGIIYSKESADGKSFPATPADLMRILNTSKETLFGHEKKANLKPRRSLEAPFERQYSDQEITTLAEMTRGVRVIKNDFGTTIIGPTGNTAFIKKD